MKYGHSTPLFDQIFSDRYKFHSRFFFRWRPSLYTNVKDQEVLCITHLKSFPLLKITTPYIIQYILHNKLATPAHHTKLINKINDCFWSTILTIIQNYITKEFIHFLAYIYKMGYHFVKVRALTLNYRRDYLKISFCFIFKWMQKQFPLNNILFLTFTSFIYTYYTIYTYIVRFIILKSCQSICVNFKDVIFYSFYTSAIKINLKKICFQYKALNRIKENLCFS